MLKPKPARYTEHQTGASLRQGTSAPAPQRWFKRAEAITSSKMSYNCTHYLDHTDKKQIRSRARPLFEGVLRQVHTATNPAGG